MTLFSKIDAEGISGDAAPGATLTAMPEDMPLDDLARALATGESVLAEATPDPLPAGEDGSGPAVSLIDVAVRAAASLGVSMGQTSTALASFGKSAGGLFAQAEADPEATQMSPLQGCSCMACMSSGGGGGNGVGAPGPAVSLQALADYLRVTFWADYDGQSVQYYNVTNSGTGANNGVLYYNVTGTPSGGVSTYYGTYTDTNGISAARQDLVRDAFAYYEELLGIDFVETTSTSTAVDFFFIDNQSGAFQAPLFHSGKGGPIDHSIININAGWFGSSSALNDYTYQTVLHEIGHALGLGHQGLYNGSGGYAGDALFANDSWAQSMMSYFDQVENTEFSDDSYAFLLGPSAADFIALNALYGSQGYGINNAFNGNTVYGVGTNITAAQNRQFNQLADLADTNFFTISDADGIDTVDFSNYAVNQNINLTVTLTTDLRPTFSSVGGLSKNMAIAAGTIIENATTGAGNDTLTGNQYGNSLSAGDGNNVAYGGAGADSITSGSGLDTLYGGTGNDTLKGGGGSDQLFGEGSNDFIKGGAGNDTIYAGSGVDVIYGDEDSDRVVLHASTGLVGAEYYGGTGYDVLEVNGAATWDLRQAALSGFEELEFFANGADSDKTIYITGAQAIGLGAAARIDGNSNSGSNDNLSIFMDDSATQVLDMSGWIFQDWNSFTGTPDYINVYGSSVNDTITIGNAATWVSANDGNDLIYGGGENDTIKGGAGADTLYGGLGNDLMYGNAPLSSTVDAGNDFHTGGGNDTAYGYDGSDYFFGAVGASTSMFYGGGAADYFYKRSGTTAGVSETWDGGDGQDWLVWENAVVDANHVVNLATGFITHFGVNRDALVSIENAYIDNAAWIVGTTGNNWLEATGDASNDIDGGAGNDTLKGGGGNDTLRGGLGVDLIHGGADNDTIYDGDDVAGADSIYAGDGNDTLTKQSWTSSGAIKVWDGGDGFDTFNWTHIANGIDGGWVVNLALGKIVLDGSFDRDVLTGIEYVTVHHGAGIVGDAGANVLTAVGDFANSIRGGDGNDTIDGGAGNDSLEGNAGNDTVYGGTGNDALWGNDGVDYLFGADDADTLYGGLDGDTLDGWNGDDLLYGDAGDDLLLGFDGNDTIYGGLGLDSVYGEGGDDLFVIASGEGLDNIYGGSETDTVDYSATAWKLNIDLGAGTYSSGANTRTMQGVENVRTGSNTDTITGSAGVNVIYSGAGHDVIHSGGGSDQLYGESGNDLIHAQDGGETLYGGLGNDTLFGSATWTAATVFSGGDGTRDAVDFSLVSAGVTLDIQAGTWQSGALSGTLDTIEYAVGSGLADILRGNGAWNRISGGAENDLIDGRGGNDTLYGQDGDDTVLGNSGDDRMFGGSGNDSVNGGDGLDTMFGDGGNDMMVGAAGDDELYGGGNNDTLMGGIGNDLLDGGAGTDRLLAGFGVDTLTGGAGVDTFVWGATGEIGLGATSDRILDFVSGSDKIDLSGIGGLSFIGTTAFSNTAGELRYYSLGGVGYLAGDTSGNGIANFEIALINGAVVAAGDLILI